VLTLKAFLSLLKALTCHCYWRVDGSARQFVHYETNFGWMGVWDFSSEGIGSLESKALQLFGGGGIILAEGLHNFSYTLTLALQLRIIMEI
jgi:hypothetical protein